MSGPLYALSILVLFSFGFRDPVSGKWLCARFVAERHEIEARCAVWEIIGELEYRRPIGGAFSPWK